MKISAVYHDSIVFDNGDTITFAHTRDCCEDNFADFEQLDDLSRTHDYKLPLVFESVEGSGFRFGDKQWMAYVPCYSEQNGYYTRDIDIYYNGKRVLAFECELRLF